MTLTRVPRGLELKTENSGSPVDLFWAPEFRLGLSRGAELNGKPVQPRLEAHPQDTHATLKFTLPPGN